MRAGDEVTQQVLTRQGRYHEVAGNLRVKQVYVGDGARQRRYVLCHNPQEQERQRQHRERLLEQLQRELADMRPSDDGHTKRMCELKSSRRFGRYLRDNGSTLSIDWAAVRREEHYDGKWVITSNDDTLTAEDLALGYKQLMRVEECWRKLKSGLRMRPVFHWRPWRIHAHVTISVLALLLERIVEIRTGNTWRNIRDQLASIKVVEYDRGGYRIRQTSQLKLNASAVLTKLNLPALPKLLQIDPIRPDDPTDRAEDGPDDPQDAPTVDVATPEPGPAY